MGMLIKTGGLRRTTLPLAMVLPRSATGVNCYGDGTNYQLISFGFGAAWCDDPGGRDRGEIKASTLDFGWVRPRPPESPDPFRQPVHTAD
jgi:hypothetical protein